MPFDPSTGISEKVLWYRAKDLSSGSVTTWTDQSGNGADATGSGGTVATGATPSGGKAISGTSMGYTPGASFGMPHSNLIAVASSQLVGYPATKAVDGNTATDAPWVATTTTGTFRVEQRSGTAIVATSYQITGRSFTTQNPKTWTFQGSMDGSSWTTLDTQTNITSWTSLETKSFSFSNSTAYTYYRLNITANNGDAFNLGLVELKLNSVSNTPQGGELWMVLKTNGGSGPQSWKYGADASASHYTYSGDVYDDTGSTVRRNFTPTVSPASWRLYRVVVNGTNWTAYLDNTSQLTTSTSTAFWKGDPKVLDTFSGQVAEILLVGKTLTSGEVADLITYFNTEHGLTVSGGSTPSTTGVVAATAPSPTLAVAGLVTLVGSVAATAPAPTLAVTGDVPSVTTGSVAATAPAPTLAVTGDVITTGSVSATAPTPTVSVAGTVTTDPDLLEAYAHAYDEISDPLTLEWEELESYTAAWATAAETITVTVDPVTLRPGYSLKVVDMHGDVLCDLTEAMIGTATRALNGRGGLDFSLPKLSAEVAMVQQFSEVQLWRGGHLVPGGWFVVVDPGIDIDAHAVGFQCSGLSYYFERRLIGGDRTELLTNGGFESGARYWNFGWTPGGTSGRPPDHTITRDACEGGKALRVYGDSNGHRQYGWRSVDVTNTHPTEPLWVDIQAQYRIDDWDGPNKDGWSLYADVRNPSDLSKILYNESVSVDETTPRDRWLPQSVRVKVAANTTSRVTVRLYPPHGSASFDQVSIKADTALIFTKRDPWQVIEGLVTEAQNVTHGKSDLNIGSWGSWSGFKIDRPYPWKDRVKVSEAIDEVVRSRNGPDANMEVGARIRRLTVAPKQGVLYRKPVFALGDRVGDARIVSYSAGIDGDEVTTRAVVQSSLSGGGMSEVIVTSDRDDGLVLETLYQTEQDSPTSTLLEQGRTAVKYGRADVITRVVMHPEDTTTLLPPRGVTIGSVVTLDVHDGEIDVRADYRIVQIDLDPDHDQLSFAVVPEV